MNGIGIAIYIYAGFLSFIFAFIKLYAFLRYSKLERKYKKIVYTYSDSLKNTIPYSFYGALFSFTVVFAVFVIFSYFTFGLDLYSCLVIMFCYFFIIYLICFKKYKVEVYKDGFYFNQFYTWKGFNGYEKINEKIKLIGKKWVLPDVYLKDRDGRIEEILEEYFKH